MYKIARFDCGGLVLKNNILKIQNQSQVCYGCGFRMASIEWKDSRNHPDSILCICNLKR